MPTTGCDASGVSWRTGQFPPRPRMHDRDTLVSGLKGEEKRKKEKGLLRQRGACVWWGGKNYAGLRRG